MKKFVNLIECILIELVFIAVLYCFGAFCNWNFEISTWEKPFRFLLGIFWIVGNIIIIALLYED